MDLSALDAAVRAIVQAVLDGPPVAVAFDADGTLWPDDVGEAFLRWLVEHRHVPAGANGDAWTRYQRLLAVDGAAAFGFAVRVLEGRSEAELVEWARPLVESQFVPRLYPPMRALLAALAERGHRVWIVSASAGFLVRIAAAALGLAPDRVIGVSTRVEGGRLTADVEQPVPCGAGKVERLRALKVRPALAAGNSRYDREMLAAAGRAFVVVERRAPREDALSMAREQGWPVQPV